MFDAHCGVRSAQLPPEIAWKSTGDEAAVILSLNFCCLQDLLFMPACEISHFARTRRWFSPRTHNFFNRYNTRPRCTEGRRGRKSALPFPGCQPQVASPWERRAPRGWCRRRRRSPGRQTQRRRPAAKTGSSWPEPWSGTAPAGARGGQESEQRRRHICKSSRQLFLIPEGLPERRCLKLTAERREKTTPPRSDAINYWHHHKTEMWAS